MSVHALVPRASRRGALGAVLGAAAALALAVAPALATPPGWSNPKEVLDLRGGPTQAMALDSHGYVHIVADGGFGQGLTYISDEPADGDSTPSWFSIKLTNKEDHHPSISIFDDRVYIAFERRDPDTFAAKGIWTATNATGTFVVAKRNAGPDHNPSVSAADGHWHISFSQGGALKYMSDVGGWSPQTIDASCCAGPSALQLTSGGLVRVAYPDGSSSSATGLKYASRTAGGAWSAVTVDSHAIKFAALVLSSSDVPYLAYDRTGAGTYWSFKSGATWPHQLVSSDHGQPDISRYSGGHFAVVSANSQGHIRFSVVGNGPVSSVLLTGFGNFGPKVDFHNKAKVTFTHEEGATPVDGVWFMKQT